jgi:solute carrier family 25 phosphate transporter 23/24/25/41
MSAPDTSYVTAVHAVSGAIGGVLSRTVTAPADRVRTLMQAGLGLPVRAPGLDKAGVFQKYGPFHPEQGYLKREGALRRAIQHIYRHGGWRGFYRGNGTNCLKVAPDAALQFAVNRLVTDWFAGDVGGPTLGQRFIAGGIAGAASQTFIHPVDVIKTQMTVAESGEYKGILECVRRTANDKALGTSTVVRFYRGYTASLIGIVPYMGTKLGLYTFVCSEYKRRNDGCALRGARDTLVATGCSFISIAVAYPFNLARTKLQVQGVNGRSMLYTGVFNCLQTTVEHERIIGLYRGFVPNLIKALPAQTILLQVQRRISDVLLGRV